MAVTRQIFKDLANKFVNDTFADFTKSFIFQSLTETPDGQGGYTTAWVNFKTVTGFVSKLTGGEMVETAMGATRIDSNEMFKFQFEFVTGITDDLRISYNGEVYNIKTVKTLQEADIFIMVEAQKGEPT